VRTNPSDLNQDGSPIHNVVYHYNSALRAIYEVRQSVQNFHIMEESGRIVDIRKIPIPDVYPTDPNYLLEENQKLSLGHFWKVLRLRPAKNARKSSNNPDPNVDPNPPNPSDMVVEEGEDAASSTEDIDLMLFQRGETDEDNTQSEIRQGQADPGGWVI
jgi:hypothetical protein